MAGVSSRHCRQSCRNLWWADFLLKTKRFAWLVVWAVEFAKKMTVGVVGFEERTGSFFSSSWIGLWAK